jgi:ketosteroid isomerase-like protein
MGNFDRAFLFISFDTAKAILEAAQGAWAAGSVEGVLDKYVDDLLYVSNTGGPNGEILTINGKDALRRRFMAAMAAVDSQTKFEAFRYENGIARTRLSAVIRHRATGHTLTCSLRQIICFREFQICKQEDFHDAAKMVAFWRLVGNPFDQPHKTPEPETH